MDHVFRTINFDFLRIIHYFITFVMQSRKKRIELIDGMREISIGNESSMDINISLPADVGNQNIPEMYGDF